MFSHYFGSRSKVCVCCVSTTLQMHVASSHSYLFLPAAWLLLPTGGAQQCTQGGSGDAERKTCNSASLLEQDLEEAAAEQAGAFAAKGYLGGSRGVCVWIPRTAYRAPGFSGSLATAYRALALALILTGSDFWLWL